MINKSDRKNFMILSLLLILAGAIITLVGFGMKGCNNNDFIFSIFLLFFVLLIFSVYVLVFYLPLITGSAKAKFLALSIIGIIGSPTVMLHSLSAGLIQLGIGIASIGFSFFSGLIIIALSKKFVFINRCFNSYQKNNYNRKR